MQCSTHPNVETLLSCGKCDKPICPRCLVHTPVGARCKECANVRRSPIYEVSALYYVKAAGAGLGLALAGGVVWALLRGVPFASIITSIIVGLAIGEGISRVANRKRGVGLQIIAAISVIASSFVGKAIQAAFFYDLSGQTFARYVISVDVYLLLFLGVGVFYAIGRLR